MTWQPWNLEMTPELINCMAEARVFLRQPLTKLGIPVGDQSMVTIARQNALGFNSANWVGGGRGGKGMP